MRTHKTQALVLSLGLALLGAVAGVSGCGANLSPVLNPSHVPIAGVPGGGRAVHDAILRAVADKGWTLAGDAPGVVRASIQKDTFMATVAIAYTGTEYSITYESSSNLKFDGKRIHKRYNVWIDRLRAQINVELQKPAAPPS
jgi:hypothetical protein